MGIMNHISCMGILLLLSEYYFVLLWGSHGRQYKHWCLLGCDAVWTGEILLLPLSALIMETVGPSEKCYTGCHFVKISVGLW